jgi:hypothetical protein
MLEIEKVLFFSIAKQLILSKINYFSQLKFLFNLPRSEMVRDNKFAQ